MKRAANLCFLLLFLVGLAAVPLGTLLAPKSSTSFWENRSLTSLPQLSTEGILDGSFFTDTESCFSDHIVWRDGFMALNTWADLNLLGRPVVSDQVVTDEVILNFHGYGQWDISYQQQQAQEMGDALAALSELVKGYGGYFCYLGVPQQFSYYSDRYPDYMDNRQWSIAPARQAFAQALEERGIPYVDMLAVYDAQGRPETYYSTVDHHYTFAGALEAYEALLTCINEDTGLGLDILREGEGLEVTTLDNHYLGSKTRKLYDLWPSEEKAQVGYPSPAIPFTRTDNGTEVEATVYDLPESPEEDVLYTLYMGGDVAETIIRTDRPDLPSALIFGESYTNALETVLWTAFDETRSLDLRYYTGSSLEEYLETWQPDVVICLRDDSSYLNPLS